MLDRLNGGCDRRCGNHEPIYAGQLLVNHGAQFSQPVHAPEGVQGGVLGRCRDDIPDHRIHGGGMGLHEGTNGRIALGNPGALVEKRCHCLKV